MLFNSIDFAVFLPIVFLLYWFVANKNLRLQNFLIVVSSYIFYGWWDWRFLSLIIFSSLIDFFIGKKLSICEKPSSRKFLIGASLALNLGLLGVFKYFNFFIDNFSQAFSLFGIALNPNRLSIVLPVGISFYTFQTLSYSIDVYRKKMEPTNDLISFLAFVSFFPQLVAGPIERASNLLPQFYRKRIFNNKDASNGLRQILWGLFKKVVIADNCAEYVNIIFSNSSSHSGSSLLIGTLFFAFQIYGDFSGYSDIAIGTAKLFGFRLMKNFAFPYFSRDIAEFWRRWHISLSTWFRDYLYIPLGGSKGNLLSKIRNTFIIFIVSGFWHGANWTFIIWGFLNAAYFLPLLISNKNRVNLDIAAKGKFLPSIKEFIQILFTFSLTLIAWIFFRAENTQQAFAIIGELFSYSILSAPYFPKQFSVLPYLLLIFIVLEWIGRENNFAIEKVYLSCKLFYRWTFFSFLIFLIVMYMQTKETPFIYFQF
ncbi:MAG: membrane-bound O-acyltransferase family protein [Ignavibacteriales bacterium CG_4_9_14_3_um_filter_34_10]|nr:MAG: membrane-bound O-acyltransferase family protein [Ignavibacteriales bacterium CG_4_9_14_3_um_filter_34_10]